MLCKTWNGRILSRLRVKKVGIPNFLEEFNGFHIIEDDTRPIRIDGSRKSIEDKFEWRLAGGNTFLSSECDKVVVRRDYGIKEAVGNVKGLLDPISKFQSEARIFANEATLYKCDYFYLQYYPPEHFLSMFRKSRPAVICKPVQDVFINGRIEQDSEKLYTVRNEELSRIATKFQAMVNNSKSKKPKDYAVHRRSLRISLKNWFIQEWCSLKGSEAVDEQITMLSIGHETVSNSFKYIDNCGRSIPGIAKDGYYLYTCMIFPDHSNKEEYENHVRKSVKLVADKTWEDIYKPGGKFTGKKESWVERANSKVKVNVVNRFLAHSEAPYRLTKEEV